MLRILTDRGAQYCGSVVHHDYQKGKYKVLVMYVLLHWFYYSKHAHMFLRHYKFWELAVHLLS